MTVFMSEPRTCVDVPAARIAHGIMWVLWLCATIAGCRGRPSSPEAATRLPTSAVVGTASTVTTLIRFSDGTESSGVRFEYRNDSDAGHYAILESLGGGAALFDFDGDGALDIFLPGGGVFRGQSEIVGRSGTLFRNLGNRTFEDVTAAANARSAPYYSHGAACGDFNSDGFPDLLVTGYGGLVLFCNLGDGTFAEIAHQAGLMDELWSSSAAWGDLNGDGVLDLYVAHYVNWSFSNHPFCDSGDRDQRDVCPPRRFEALPHILYFGNGDGTFRDGSREAGIETEGATGKGLGVLLADGNVGAR